MRKFVLAAMVLVSSMLIMSSIYGFVHNINLWGAPLIFGVVTLFVALGNSDAK